MPHCARYALLVMAILAARTGNAQVAPAAGASELPTVETVGTGERRVPPDRATVMLFIETRAPAAAMAASANARVVAAVRDTLARLELDSTTTTASYHVGPDYEAPTPVERSTPAPRRGYLARSAIRVELHRLEQVGRVIDAGLARGASGVEGVFFSASTAEDAHRAALGEAAQAARRDAEALARALGGRLGPVVSVSTAGGMDPRRMNVVLRSGAGYGAGATAVTPNEIIVTAGVVTRWRLLPATP